MKLIKLTIKETFRSLFTDFEINFREENPNEQWKEFHPFCFAGLNGSGKSNVLEALGNIFFHLECCTLNDEYSDYLKSDFDKSKSSPSAYELEYYIVPKGTTQIDEKSLVRVVIKKEKRIAPQISVTAQDQAEEGTFEEVSNSIRTFLPELVIGYSSGENEILSLPFVKSRLLQFDEYLKFLKDKKKYDVNYDLDLKPESSLVYMDYHMSQAILLANFLLQGDDSLKPLRDQLDIDKIDSFRLVINNHKLYYESDDPALGPLKPLADAFIDKLRKCATVNYVETDKDGDNKIEYLDYYVNEVTRNAFQIHFGSPLQLFRAFQVLMMLNLRIIDNTLKKEIYNSDSLYAMYKIPVPKEDEHIFHFNVFKIKKNDKGDKMLLKAFSDGEHQFLHTMGICLMLKDKNALMLLDEPETHFNPEWRSEFISLLKESLAKSGANHLMRDIIITSHSPFIISDCFPDKVIVFEKGKQPKSAFDKNFRTFGTSVDLIMEHIFKRNNTIGDLSAQVIEDIKNEIAEKSSLTEEEVKKYKGRTADLGDSMEKILLFTKLNELKKANVQDV